MTNLASLDSTLASFGPALANHLWQSTAFALGAWLLTLALRSNQARVRHAVWLAASIKFLLPFSLLIAAGNLLPHPKQAVAPVVYSAMDVVEEPFAQIILPPAPPVVHVPTLRERVEAALPAALGVLWLLGAAGVLLIWVGGWRIVRRTMRVAEPATEGREFEILRSFESLRRFKSKRDTHSSVPHSSRALRAMSGKHNARHSDLVHIPLRLSSARMEPGIFGIFLPVLVWPRELSERLDDAHIEAILAHELAHVRRRDNLTAAVHMLVETVFWFHPLVWWMERRMVAEREQACDEAVVDSTRPSSGFAQDRLRVCTDGAPLSEIEEQPRAQNYAEIYAEALLKTCRFCIESPLVCVAGVTGADLKQRVMDIVTCRALVRMSWPKKILLAAAAACVVAAPVVLGQAKAAQRLMLAAIKAAPKPVQAVAKAVMAEADSTGSDAQAAAPASTPSTSDIGSTAKPFDLDVVSIRPSDPNVRGPVVFGPQPDGFIALNMPLNTMLSLFYGPELQNDANRIDGGPDWVRTSSWIIRAKIAQADVAEWSKLVRDPSRAARSRLNATIQAMLASRFKLKTHFETKEGTVYALVVAKGGLKMQESAPDERGEISAHGTRFTFQKASMSTILTTIAQQVGSPVVDKTGLTGNYDFTLDSTPLRGAPPPSVDGSAPLDGPPSIFNAVEEQLGLKLVAQKGPVTHLVIDSVEKPSVDGAEVGPDASTGDEAQLSAAYRKWLDDDVHWLITPQERTDFLKLASDKDREAFIDAFWERRNPPGEAKVAYKQEIYARIADANRSYENGKPGWSTDRGRAIIQFGRPDSITVHGDNGYETEEVWSYSHLGAAGGSATLRFVRAVAEFRLQGAWPQVSAAYAPTMTFDVASVRQSHPDINRGVMVSGGFDPADSSHWRAGNNDLMNLILQAYDVNHNLIEGIPQSMGFSTTFNIEAKGDAAADEKLATLDKPERKAEQQHMVQMLLADRFHMKAHWETRDGPTYNLVVSRAGRLVSTGASPSAEELARFGSRPVPPLYQKGDSRTGFEFIAHSATVADIQDVLASQFGRPVTDKTGLAGKYDFDLKYYQTRASDRKEDETNPWEPLETAIQDQLGLKLVSTHGPVQYLVIDHIEMPSAN